MCIAKAWLKYFFNQCCSSQCATKQVLLMNVNSDVQPYFSK